MDFHPCKSSGGLPVNVHFKIRAPLLDAIRGDLRRRHAFAYERVGWISAGVSRIGDGSLFLLAQDYHPVEDADYIDDPSVGAMMGSKAIRKALQRSYQSRTAALHVHMHEHRGRPGFSGTDIRENAKFVPDFFNVAAHVPHGAIVLSADNIAGDLWLARGQGPLPIARFTAVGATLWMEGAMS
ncbi:hypothetical protein FG95_03261 [Sphingopyxis sp. LC363]|jgi:hypothetical protein|uniref:hypothetical protein n=1 Tax=unclassified Sphingopyxis TaxID=2614943 RepID=UPI00050FE562|nr:MULTISPECIES: hypothetical protein [unclassified Sphingopyxis]KGB53564.1 hypothetical protein FG95_03261 [Sphingopyxis sp. LC363]